MRKYIFPGGVIPSQEKLSLSADYKFYTTDIESLRTHYMKNFENFENNIDTVREMFDERFVRMWTMYLYFVQLALTLVS